MSATLTIGNGSVPTSFSTTKSYTVKVLNDISSATAPSYTTPISSASFTMSDVTLPVVSNVTAYGNKKVVVTFNKPILLNATKESTFAVLQKDGTTYAAGKGFNNDNLTVNYVAGSAYTQVEVDFTTAIPVGNYTLKVYGSASDARDPQGLNLIETNVPFSVAQASTVAQATGLTVVDRNTVDVTFDSAVTKPAASTLIWATGKTADSVSLVGQNTLEYTFTTNVIPTGAETFTLAGVTDAYANTIPTKTFAVTVAADSISTATVTSKATNVIKVTYSKDMLQGGGTYAVDNKANYVVKDSDGNILPITVSYSNTSSVYVATITGTFDPGTYTVSVSGVKDLVGQAMTAVSSVGVTVPDTVAPSFAAVKVSGVTTGKKFVVTYDKAMSVSGSTSIANASNYQYSALGSTYTDLPTGTTLVPSSDCKSVTITLPATATFTAGTSMIQLGNVASSTVNVVADSVGNIIDTLPGTSTRTTITDETTAAPSIAAQATSITGANTIRVALNGAKASLASVDKADLLYSIDGTVPSITPVDAKIVTVSGVEYIEITTDSDNTMDATTLASNVKVKTIATTTNSKSALGTALAGGETSTGAAKTTFAASIGSVEVQDSTHVKLYVNGILANTAALKVADLKLYQNGVVAGGTITPTKVGDTATGSVYDLALGTAIDPDAAVTIKTVSQDSMATVDQNSKALVANTTGVTGSIKLMATTLTPSNLGTGAVIANNDTFAIAFNRSVDPSTIVSGWDGTGTKVVDVKVSHTTGAMTIEGVGTIKGFTAPTGGVDEDFATSTVSYSAGTLTITLIGGPSPATTKNPLLGTLTFVANSAIKSTSGTSVSTNLITISAATH